MILRPYASTRTGQLQNFPEALAKISAHTGRILRGRTSVGKGQSDGLYGRRSMICREVNQLLSGGSAPTSLDESIRYTDTVVVLFGNEIGYSLKGNTVALRFRDDPHARVPSDGSLLRVAVCRGVLAHLPLHGSRVVASPARGDGHLEHFLQDGLMESDSSLRGEKPRSGAVSAAPPARYG